VDNNQCVQFSTHGATSVVLGPDNFLYAGFGDGAAFTSPDVRQMGGDPCKDNPGYPGAFRAQDPNRLNGKVVRVDPATLQWAVFTSGHRNPWRLSWYNGQLLEGETGWYMWEEINILQPAQNYGWPCYEGPEVRVVWRGLGTLAPWAVGL
jgi:glucose/arabinose dehydrogenase